MPDMGNFEGTNLKILQDMLKNIDSLKKKTKDAYDNIDSKGDKRESKQEFRRVTKDGRVAIFDENRNFLRYEE
jgi:hypothetical protein